MLKEQNERLTRVGPGTPMGELLRRYWHPVAALSEMTERPVKRVRILGERLVLYRDRRGRLGLVGETCAHRRVSLSYGIPEEDGLRCPYHGWKYDRTGQCIEQPAEPPESVFKHKIRIPAYPVEALGGLVFAYLGPEPAPLLPRWQPLVQDGVLRDIGVAAIPCNWLQIMDNSLDPTHVEWLHQHFNNYVFERLGRAQDAQRPLHHVKTGFDRFEHGIIKRRVLEGQTEEHDDWRVGHPVLFPNILLSGSTRRPTLNFRVPMDDTHTMHWWYSCYAVKPGVAPSQDAIPLYEVPVPSLDGDEPQWSLLDSKSGQDAAMWCLQGPIADRSLERLGESDKGIILYRKLLEEQLVRVEQGEEPMNVLRDPDRNTCIELALEKSKLADWKYNPSRQAGVTKYSPVLEDEARREDKLTQVPTDTGI